MFSIYVAVISGNLFWYSSVAGICRDYGSNLSATLHHVTVNIPNVNTTDQVMTCTVVPSAIVTVPQGWTETDIGQPVISKP